MKQFDILIIGAGAVGNAIAREISKNNMVAVGVLEKEPDTGFGISGRNSGVLHAGFNNKPGSLMGRFCVQGSEDFEKEAAELNLPFKRTGKLIVARLEEDLGRLQKLKEQGEANGVRELRIIGREELKALAGYDAGEGALWSGMTGIFDPFQYTIALAEAASAQGTKYYFGRQTVKIETASDRNLKRGLVSSISNVFLVTAENKVNGQKEHFQTRVLINSAGLYADDVCRMAGINDFKIFPCRGEYHILDKKHSGVLELPIYPVPNEKEGGLGVHLTPTAHGNIMIGPSAEYFETGQEREDYSTTQHVMDKLGKEGKELYPDLDMRGCIRSFAGVRPKLAAEYQGGYADFIIEESKQVPGFIQLVGIESPGLTASIPIAKMVAEIADEIMLQSGEPGVFREFDANIGRIENNPVACGEPGSQKMLCQCEGITEEQVLESFDRILNIGAIPTIRGLKNRSRVTMGSCQGSFCTIRLIELLRDKRNVDPLTLLWNGFGSLMFDGRVKE